VRDIDRRSVARELHRIGKEHGEIAANRARSALSALFSWAIREGLAEANPVIGTNKAVEERSRERVLADDELRAVWQATANLSAYNRIVRLLLLTACRREEVGALAWREVDLGAGTITIPGDRTKNGRPHIVPLAGPALALLEAVPRVGDLVFTAAGRGFAGWAGQKERLDQRIARDRRDAARPDRHGEPLTPEDRGTHALPAWRLHDLRRTAATRMADLGVDPHVIEEILGHVGWHRAGVAGIYNRASYDRAKRTALGLWAEKFLELVEGQPATVVPLRRPTR
jgi:integrase